jgi:hypothetical protein
LKADGSQYHVRKSEIFTLEDRCCKFPERKATSQELLLLLVTNILRQALLARKNFSAPAVK